MSQKLFVADEMEVDEVVAEIPVYLNDNVGNKLVLLQYPTRGKGTSVDSELARVAVKPQSGSVQAEVRSAVPPQLIRDGSLSGLDQQFEGTLASTGNRYGIGYVQNGELHLSLVSQAAQLRPQFQAAAAPSALSAVNGAASGAAGRSSDGGQGLRSVQMSAKSTSAEVPRHSSVLEQWRLAQREEPVEYVVDMEASRDVLVCTEKEQLVEPNLDKLLANSAGGENA